MITMYGSADDRWPAGGTALWVTVVDLTLPLAPVFWELADLATTLLARLSQRGGARRIRPALGLLAR